MHWRHEQLSIAMALVDALHHSAQPRARAEERETNSAPRRHEPLPTVTSTQYFSMADDESVLVVGARPPSLGEPPGPCGQSGQGAAAGALRAAVSRCPSAAGARRKDVSGAFLGCFIPTVREPVIAPEAFSHEP